MNEIIVTCAGCSRRYKGVPGPKKFRCTSCDNHLTFPREPHEAIEGTVYCSSCWTGVSLNDGVTQCPVCSQKIDPNIGGGKASWPSGNSGVRPAVNPAEDARRNSALQEALSGNVVAPTHQSSPAPSTENRSGDSRSMEQKLAEYQTRLALWQESQAAVIKERDELAQERRTLEQKVVELSARLDGVTAARDQMMRERDQATASRHGQETRLAELEAKLSVAADLHAKSEEDMQAARMNERAAEKKAMELEAKLNAMQELYCAVLNDRNELDGARRQLEVGGAESEARLASLRAQLEQAQSTAAEDTKLRRSLEDKIAELTARIEAARDQQNQALAARDMIVVEKAKVEARVNELQIKVAEMQLAADAARRELEESRAQSSGVPAQMESLKRLLDETTRERDEALAERTNAVSILEQQRLTLHAMELKLQQFHDGAAQALDPLNAEYARVARELTSEAERVLAHVLQLESELGLRKERLRALENTLGARLGKSCREAMERMTGGAATKGSDSTIAPAVEIPSGMPSSGDWHAASTTVNADAVEKPEQH